jgi:hypothetical protein
MRAETMHMQTLILAAADFIVLHRQDMTDAELSSCMNSMLQATYDEGDILLRLLALAEEQEMGLRIPPNDSRRGPATPQAAPAPPPGNFNDK